MTSRQHEILTLRRQQVPRKAIAQMLGISVNTVKTTIRRHNKSATK